jgi:hypothetical protein
MFSTSHIHIMVMNNPKIPEPFVAMPFDKLLSVYKKIYFGLCTDDTIRCFDEKTVSKTPIAFTPVTSRTVSHIENL